MPFPRLAVATCALLLTLGTPPLHAAPAAKPAIAAAPNTLETSPEGRALHAAWVKADYRFTPQVKAAHLAFAKAQAQAQLAAANQALPADFLAWVDSDPVVAGTVYGSAQPAADILRVLRSLELDLGQNVVRKQYTQLVLAMAVVNANQGPAADLSARAPMTLVIPPDPLTPVNTKDPKRPLDANDHIINFLNDHTLEYEVKVQGTRTVTEANPKDPSQPLVREVPDPKAPKKTEKRSRPMVAYDVMASKDLQAQFNAYMKEKGQAVEIHCETPRRGTIPPADRAAILKASNIFRAAYIAKGLLPEKRDATPTLAETCAFLIRNDRHRFPEGAKQVWPRFPLTAPWPVLVYLAQVRQPLRECEDMWQRFVTKNEIHGYGQYVGNIAQYPPLLEARSMAPYDFGYGSFQMMLKDGGVCGTMANIDARNKLALGVPASTAGQPGHCALVYFRFDAQNNTFDLAGGQFVTGGVWQTTPHAPWIFNGGNGRRGMLWHQTDAWNANFGLPAYLDSMQAAQFLRLLPESDRQAHGLALAESALALDPYNATLAESAQALATTAEAQFHLWQTLQTAFTAAAAKPGCPVESPYSQTLKNRMMDALAKLPVPANPQTAQAIDAFLKAEKNPDYAALAHYQAALEGLPATLAATEAALKAHLTAPRTPALCNTMADRLAGTCAQITDAKARKAWARERLGELIGHEMYFGGKYRLTLDASVPVTAKLAGQKMPPEKEQVQPLLDEVAARLQTGVAGARNLKDSRALAGQINAIAPQIRDAQQKSQWLEALSKTLVGHETFDETIRKKPVTRSDPCAEVVAKLTAPPAVVEPKK